MNIVAVILAAGNGIRFGNSDVNKTAVKISGKSLIQIGIENIQDLVDSIVVVVGYKKMSVINSIHSNKVIYVNQTKRLGTGHAIKLALKKIGKFQPPPENILVANGDHLFMIDPFVLKSLLKKHVGDGNDVTILTTINKQSYPLDNGRIIRKNGQIISIIEKIDFTPKIRSISELNTGTYVFKFGPIVDALEKSQKPNRKELYITESLFKLNKIGSYTVTYGKVGPGVNTRQELEQFRTTNPIC